MSERSSALPTAGARDSEWVVAWDESRRNSGAKIKIHEVSWGPWLELWKAKTKFTDAIGSARPDLTPRLAAPLSCAFAVDILEYIRDYRLLRHTVAVNEPGVQYGHSESPRPRCHPSRQAQTQDARPDLRSGGNFPSIFAAQAGLLAYTLTLP
ncbi:hypothetical protein NUW54_g4201 [Trametes sanguinea]|uniref:Uncharacterized protein n=1 Tax=Trametes sanguinea TaxID=158606 RepID=A0ACC1Q256_9APHY|nr:hypothetical protein NUW54_g4201 [Trametes sanguinea]